MEEIYNKHYILLDEENRVDDGWSDGPHPEKETAGAVCIEEKGGYQFRLFPDGEENPSLIDEAGVHLWKYEGGGIIATSEEEREEERASFPQPEPSREKQLEERLTQLQAQMDALLGVKEDG